MVTYQYDKETNLYKFKLISDKSASGKYIAVGFSEDDKMGKDLVIYCSTNGENIKYAWTLGKNDPKELQSLNVINPLVGSEDGVSFFNHVSMPALNIFTMKVIFDK